MCVRGRRTEYGRACIVRVVVASRYPPCQQRKPREERPSVGKDAREKRAKYRRAVVKSPDLRETPVIRQRKTTAEVSFRRATAVSSTFPQGETEEKFISDATRRTSVPCARLRDIVVIVNYYYYRSLAVSCSRKVK